MKTASNHSPEVMAMIESGKLFPASKITPPLELPDFVQPCDQCERDTPTKVKYMRAGYGNACACCGRLRRGKPYLSNREFNQLKPSLADGGHDEAEAV